MGTFRADNARIRRFGLALVWALMVAPVLTILACPAVAEDGATLIGEGAQSCADFVERYDEDPDYADETFMAWARGYMVGINTRNDRFYDLAPEALRATRQRDHAYRYCRHHPRTDFIEAARDLYRNIVAENAAQGN